MFTKLSDFCCCSLFILKENLLMLKLILSRTIIEYGGQFCLNNTVFSLCSSATSGGAIFVDHSSSNLSMIGLAFDRCRTNVYYEGE